MKKEELIESVRHVAGYYDLYNSSIVANNQLSSIIPFLQVLVTLMWVNQYSEDVHSRRIREQLKNLYEIGGFVFS